jgi:DNA-binding response OmpR family regulator
MAKILLVEDDEELAGMVKDWLSFDRHVVEHTVSGNQGLELLKQCQFELVILDWQLPDLSGPELLRSFRARGGMTPVLMLTGRRSIQDKEEGFESGCDDYLTKPFQGKELTLRVKALLRRSPVVVDSVLKHGDIELDPEKFQVRRSGQEIRLLPKEFALLEFLLRHPEKLFGPEELLSRVWASETEATAEALTTCIKRLRKKMDRPGEPSVIRNVHGIGYGLWQPGA